MNPEENALACFGTDTVKEECESCVYRDACRFSAEDTKRTMAEDSRWSGSSQYVDRFDGTSRENLLPVDISGKRTYSQDEVVALSAFLLRVGKDRKLGKILTAKLMGAQSFAEIARREGVTRQAIHKRVGKQLAKIFGFKSRRLTDSRLLTLDTDEFRLLKLTRAGTPDEDIQEILDLPRAEYRKLKASLDYKLMRYT